MERCCLGVGGGNNGRSEGGGSPGEVERTAAYLRCLRYELSGGNVGKGRQRGGRIRSQGQSEGWAQRSDTGFGMCICAGSERATCLWAQPLRVSALALSNCRTAWVDLIFVAFWRVRLLTESSEWRFVVRAVCWKCRRSVMLRLHSCIWFVFGGISYLLPPAPPPPWWGH